MRTSEFKKLAKITGVKYIKNQISGHHEWVTYTKPDGTKSLMRKFTPFTDRYGWSNWMVCLPVKYRGISMNAWFNIYHPSKGETECFYFLDHIWDGGRGKKLRRDASWNIVWNLRLKAEKADKKV